MSRTEKASEPSMEEILASIRKIISEEPAGAKPVAAPNMPAAAPSRGMPFQASDTLPGEAKSAQSVQPAERAETKSPFASSRPEAKKHASDALDMDDVLGLADDVPTQRPLSPNQPRAQSLAAATATVPGVGGVPSWLFPKPGHEKPAAGSAARIDAPPVAAIPAPQPTPQTSIAAAAPKPFFPPAPRETAAAPQNQMTPAPQPHAAQADLGTVVPSRSPAAHQPATIEASPRLPELKIDGSRPGAGNPGPLNGQFNRGPAAIEGMRNGEPAHNGASPSQQARAPEPMALNGHHPLAHDQRPASPPANRIEPPANRIEPLPPMVERAPLANGHNGGINGRPSVEPANIPAPPMPTSVEFAAAQVALAQSETATVAAAKPAPSPITVTRHEPAPQPLAQPAPAAATAPGPVARAVASAAPMPAPVVAAPVAVTVTPAAAAPTDEPSRTMEDTVAELLRPMLRQWLDNNMPRIVERALRVELAASAKPKIDPAKH